MDRPALKEGKKPPIRGHDLPQDALFAAGNADTVLRLWPANDQATAEFVSRFLSKVKDGQPHPQALAATKREFMNDTNPQLRSPCFWAPFVLYGG